MKMKQKKVYLTVGIPASGKSSFVRKQIAQSGGVCVSRDEVRFSMLKDEDAYFQNENAVFEEFVKRAQAAIDGPEDVYIDATHISVGSRKKILNRLNLNNTDEVIMLYFDVPLAVAMERNELRTGRSLVPETAMLSMAKGLTKPYSTERIRVWTINEDGEVVSIE